MSFAPTLSHTLKLYKSVLLDQKYPQKIYIHALLSFLHLKGFWKVWRLSEWHFSPCLFLDLWCSCGNEVIGSEGRRQCITLTSLNKPTAIHIHPTTSSSSSYCSTTAKLQDRFHMRNTESKSRKIAFLPSLSTGRRFRAKCVCDARNH